MRRVMVPIAKSSSAYIGGALSGHGTVHQGSRAGSLRPIDQILRTFERAMSEATTDWYDCRAGVRQERRKRYGENVGHDRHEPWANVEHKAIVQT